MDPSDDTHLFDGLRQGDPQAFDEAHARYSGRIFGFLLRMTGRRDVAEELSQETWLRLARHGRRLEPGTRLAPWLFTVARNLHLSWRRWAVVDAARLALVGRLPGRDVPTPAEEAAAGEQVRRLEAGLAALPPVHREILLLVGVEGMTPTEAAGVLGLSPEASRQRLARARAALQQEMGGS